MKTFLYFAIVATTYFCLASAHHHKNVYSYGESSYYLNKDSYHGTIERPCPHLHVDCVRPFLTEKLKCNPVHTRGYGEFPYNNIKHYFPHSNTTMILNEAVIKGFDKFEINEFYVNKATNAMVIEVILPKIHVESYDTELTYLLKGRQPVKTYGKVTVTYKSISLTMTVYEDCNEIEIFPYIMDPDVRLNYDSHLVPTDPEALGNFHTTLGSLTATYVEGFITQGPLFMERLIMTAFCKMSLTNSLLKYT